MFLYVYINVYMFIYTAKLYMAMKIANLFLVLKYYNKCWNKLKNY